MNQHIPARLLGIRGEAPMKSQEKKTYPTRSPDREANERFVHLRNCNNSYPNGRMVDNVTAFIRTIDGVDYVSFAETDIRDQFCRKTGRVVARRKWFNGKRVLLVPGGNAQEDRLYERALDTYYAENS
jgi:hypothetical protein